MSGIRFLLVRHPYLTTALFLLVSAPHVNQSAARNHQSFSKLPLLPWVNMFLTKPYRLRSEVTASLLTQPCHCPQKSRPLPCLLPRRPQDAGSDLRRMLTKRTRSRSVIFFDIENDVRRRPFSFDKNENVVNMKRKS